MNQKYISTSLKAREAHLAIRNKYLPTDRLENEVNQTDIRIKKFLRHQLVYEHLNKALEFLNTCKLLGIPQKSDSKLQEHEDTNATSIFALTIGAIMMYCKPFTKNSGPLSGKPLQASKYFKNKPEITKTHKLIINMRHKFIAHSGNSDYESMLAFLNFSNSSEISLEADHTYKYSFDLDEIHQFKRLIKHLKHDIGIELDDYQDKFLNSLAEEEKLLFLNSAKKIRQQRLI